MGLFSTANDVRRNINANTSLRNPTDKKTQKDTKTAIKVNHSIIDRIKSFCPCFFEIPKEQRLKLPKACVTSKKDENHINFKKVFYYLGLLALQIFLWSKYLEFLESTYNREYTSSYDFYNNFNERSSGTMGKTFQDHHKTALEKCAKIDTKSFDIKNLDISKIEKCIFEKPDFSSTCNINAYNDIEDLIASKKILSCIPFYKQAIETCGEHFDKLKDNHIYRKINFIFHPDKNLNPNAQKIFNQINNAKDYLKSCSYPAKHFNFNFSWL